MFDQMSGCRDLDKLTHKINRHRDEGIRRKSGVTEAEEQTSGKDRSGGTGKI